MRINSTWNAERILTWNCKIILCHMRQMRIASLVLVPPSEQIVNSLDATRWEVPVKLIRKVLLIGAWWWALWFWAAVVLGLENAWNNKRSKKSMDADLSFRFLRHLQFVSKVFFIISLEFLHTISSAVLTQSFSHPCFSKYLSLCFGWRTKEI